MSDTPFDIAQARLKAVEQMEDVLAREREQVEVLKQIAEERRATLLNGTTSLHAALRKYEGELISTALKISNKSVVKAAKELGISYQALAYAIDSRHQELLPERSPIRRRNGGS